MPIQKIFKYEQDRDAPGQHPLIPQVVYVQNSTHLAGAQKSLSRLLAAGEMGKFSPRLLTGRTGWLTDFCDAKGIPWNRLDFPSSRSLAGRLWGNRWFGARAGGVLGPHLEERRPVIVHANDHPDSVLGLEVARKLGAVPVMTLRTPGMSERDFVKYRCGEHRHLIAVGEELYRKVKGWVREVPVSLVYNGVTGEEILPPVSRAAAPLDRVVVLGSMSPRKGWQDLVEALLLLEGRLPEGTLPEFHFLGDCLGMRPEEVLGTERLGRFVVRFSGVAADYRERLRGFPLAVHPSRSESFGMAALECVAAGVPLLAASAGMIPEFIPDGAFRFAPGDVGVLAARLEDLLQAEPDGLVERFNFPAAHERIGHDFSTGGTVGKLAEIYRSVAG